MIFTLEENHADTTTELTGKNLCMYLMILLLEASQQKIENEENRGNALFFTLD